MGISTHLAAAVTALATGAAAMAAEVFYVAPGGNDAWSGRLREADPARTDGPFATPARARDAVRGLRADGDGRTGPVTIRLRGGVYFLQEPLRLDARDSGTAGSPTVWQAEAGERPVLSAGCPIPDWHEVEPGTWEAPLPSFLAGPAPFRSLFLALPGGEWRRRFRPDRGAFVIAGLTSAPTRAGATMAHRRSQDEFRFFPEDIVPFANLGEVEVVALHDWSASRLRVREVDMAEHVVRFTGFPVYRIGHWWQGGRNPYYVENAREDFGQPGRFFVDTAAARVRYRALPGEDLRGMQAVVPQRTQLLELQGDAEAGSWLEHVRFEGLAFQHTHWLLPESGYSSGQGMIDLPAAVEAAFVRQCCFERCRFEHLDAYALRLGRGCCDNRVLGNVFHDLGGGGVLVGVTQAHAAPPVLPTGNEIASNLISDGGLVHFSAHGIWVGIAQGTRVHHNLVRRFPYSAVSCGWVWNDTPSSCRDNAFEYNHIHDAMMLLADGGGFYSLGFQPGMVLRGNLVHDVHRSIFAGRAPNNGFFLDQGSKGFRIEHNIVYATSGKPVRHNQNTPEGHTWVDNTFDLTPRDAAFPRERAAAAGPAAAYRDLAAAAPAAIPHPMLAMDLPRRPPNPIRDDCENTPIGEPPVGAAVQGEDAGRGATIRVAEGNAASGRRSIRYVKVPGLAKSFYPYLFYAPALDEGVCLVRVAVCLDTGASLQIEGRDESRASGYAVGPSVVLTAGAGIRHGERELASMETGTWTVLAFRFGAGTRADGRFDLEVMRADGTAERFPGLTFPGSGFRRLDWLGFVAQGSRQQVIHLDDLSIALEPPNEY
ncbi:MAG: right-handed parallel beta-helix repeat-containing protein [Lentisphaeria bacterium]|nr:right-handed parallel beta-helix repeat-containing protein [Lentisphaeria bacterium]